MLPPLTTELALRLERHLGRGLILEPDGAVYLQLGETVATKAKDGRPRNKVIGFGKDDLQHLDKILAFYGADRLHPTFYLSPMRFSEDVGLVLANRGFIQQEFEQAILYGVPAPAAPEPPASITIDPVTADNAEAYVQTLAHGFEWHAGWRDAAMAAERDKLDRPGPHRFLAHVAGEPAGVGTLSVRDGIASLGGGATLPRFRRRGVHLALVHHRVHIAQRLGAELISSGASFGSPSFRNQHRAGLHIAYLESAWSRRS